MFYNEHYKNKYAKIITKAFKKPLDKFTVLVQVPKRYFTLDTCISRSSNVLIDKQHFTVTFAGYLLLYMTEIYFYITSSLEIHLPKDIVPFTMLSPATYEQCFHNHIQQHKCCRARTILKKV